MKAWNYAPPGSVNFRRSQIYWANIQGYFGEKCVGRQFQDLPGMSGSQWNNVEDRDQVWCSAPRGADYLAWNRMYLYYFEKVLQTAAQDPNLRLPYWDYQSDGHIPEAYRAPSLGNGMSNPLYVSNRQAKLNQGSAALPAEAVSVATSMRAVNYADFASLILQTPFADVNCLVAVAGCNSGYVGNPATRGLDPLAFSIAADIDRLYDCWSRAKPVARAPGAELLDKNFTFVDAQYGSVIHKTAREMSTLSQLGYSYAVGGGCR